MNYDYCDGMIYTIKKGDTLYSISRSKQVPLSMLLRANPYVDVYNLQVGDTICIPMRRKPCNGRRDRVTQENRNMSENNVSGENIETAADGGEASSVTTTAPDVMRANETDEVGTAIETVPNRMANGDIVNGNGNGSINNRFSGYDRDDDDKDDDRDDNRNDIDRNGIDRNGIDRNGIVNRRDIYDKGVSGGSFTRYVTQPGDTLADVIARSDADRQVFWENNAMDRIHLLPGISYLVFEETE